MILSPTPEMHVASALARAGASRAAASGNAIEKNQLNTR